jgi:hypothetical protein
MFYSLRTPTSLSMYWLGTVMSMSRQMAYRSRWSCSSCLLRLLAASMALPHSTTASHAELAEPSCPSDWYAPRWCPEPSHWRFWKKWGLFFLIRFVPILCFFRGGLLIFYFKLNFLSPLPSPPLFSKLCLKTGPYFPRIFPSVPVQNVSLDHVDVLWCRRFVTVDVL